MLRGRYQPIKLIGRGGFGRTYLAFDSDRLNAPCVIKQFAPQSRGTKAFDKSVTLFNQEAVRLHELGEHAQIPALLAYFEQEQYLYLVQQYIDGRTLIQEMLDQGPMNELDMHGLLQGILPVLDFIHKRSVIHRDITPSNLIRRETDRRLFVIDFGVAKQFGEVLSPEPGTRIGTEGYAPIEQFRAGQSFPSSDLYSLGATCLHLLTGQKPEKIYDPMTGSWRWRELILKRGITVSDKLGEILDRLVLDRVGDRYQNAQAVLDALKYLPKLQGQVPGWVRQHPTSQLSTTTTALYQEKFQPTIDLQAPTSPPSKPPAPPPSNPPSPKPSNPPPPPGVAMGNSSSNAWANAWTPSPSPPPSPSSSAESMRWQCARVLTGHESWVTAVAFNPRTATLASGSLDDRIKVWNLQTGSLLFTLNGHPRGVNDVAISSKGQVLVSCGDDGTTKVWDLTAGRRLHTLKGHVRDVTSVAIGHKGWILASGSKDKSINLWKLDKGTLIRTLLGSPAAVRAVAMTPDETCLLSGGLDNKVRLWDLKTGQMMRLFAGHVNPVNDVAVSRDGLFAASASKDKTVRVWSIATGSMIHCLSGHTREVNAVAIAPDNRTVVSGSTDRTVCIWDAKTGKQLHTLTGHSHTVTAIAVHRTGRLIASTSADKTIRIWKLA